jgi:N-acetylneuraminate synthase
MFGPDVPASITFEELRTLVSGVRFIELAMSNPLDKDKIAADKREMRRIFGKSVVAVSDLPAGTLLTEENLALRKPGTGLPPSELPALIGRRLKQAVRRNERLQPNHLQ